MFKAVDCEGAVLAVIPIRNVNHFIVKKEGDKDEIQEENSLQIKSQAEIFEL